MAIIKHGAPVVFTNEQGYHMVMTANGDVLSSVVETIVTDKHNDFARCQAEFICNLATDEEQAREIIAKYNK